MKGFLFFTSIFLTLFYFTENVEVAYLNQVCNAANIIVETSRRLESSTALYYGNSVSCSYHVTVSSGKHVMMLVRLFDLEKQVMNACVDYVNIHDGTSTSAATLNASPLCGETYGTNYTSTGTDMTIDFHTDTSGTRYGFDFIFVAVTTGTCGSDQFACNTSVCIDSSLKCNIYDECGDNGDEYNCTYTTPDTVDAENYAALIAGLTVGFFVIIIICVVVAFICWRMYRWKLYMKRPITAREIVHNEVTFTTTYPVTKVYYKEKFQERYAEAGKPPEVFGYTVDMKETTQLRTEVNRGYTEEGQE